MRGLVWRGVPVLLLFLAPAARTYSQITRHHEADTFLASGTCSKEVCVAESSGTASATSGRECTCRCLPNLPLFRDDLHICVDDIHECPLVPFLSGTTYQKMPYVFLPMKGQIIYPSAEIAFTGVKSPICVVSGAKFLSRGGWVELRNRTDSEPPFRLYRDEGKTFLQWLGDSELRQNMEGRLTLIHLMCKDMGDGENQDSNIITPCVAFKIAGTPNDPSSWTGVREVSFSADPHPPHEGIGSGYVAIAICSLLLGLVYVASVMLYLQARKRQTNHRPSSPNMHIGVSEEGVVKNNPLLRHCHENMNYLSDTAPSCSDSDDCSDVIPLSDDSGCNIVHSVQVTSAVVHPRIVSDERERQTMEPMQLQDTTTIERLPEENVSIVETLDNREDRPETVRAMACATTRKKLYFNPAYFEPELLLSPPPAAIEFLTKIREVISIAKTKIEAKKYLPSLIGIPEENESLRHRTSIAGSESAISLKRENSRRSCSSFNEIPERIKFDDIPGCHNCCNAINETKQRSIRQWLENVPVANPREEFPIPLKPMVSVKRSSTKGKAPTVPIQLKGNDQVYNAESVKPISSIQQTENNAGNKNMLKDDINNDYDLVVIPNQLNKKQECNTTKETYNKIGGKIDNNNSPRVEDDIIPYKKSSSPPLSVCSNTSVYNSEDKNKTNNTSISLPNIAKKLVDAINKEGLEFEDKQGKPNPPVRLDSINDINFNLLQKNEPCNRSTTLHEYDTDSLERTQEDRKCGFSTPSDYGDIDSKNVISFEDNINNSIFNELPGFPKLSNFPDSNNDDHEYEVIMIGSEYTNTSLADILSRNEGYSLVSEVYVNDGYCNSSHSSLPSISSSNSFDTEPETKYNKETTGHLTIQVEAPKTCQYDDSDNFEPDTLDRKPSKVKINSENYSQLLASRDCYMDSLERPPQISLKTTGSFRSDSVGWCGTSENSNRPTGSSLNRNFGSLREIFEAKNKFNQCTHNRVLTTSPISSTKSLNTDYEKEIKLTWKYGQPKLLRPEARQAKRQRQPSPPNEPIIKPPTPVYSEKTLIDHDNEPCPPLPPRIIKPPLPPKNSPVKSIYHEKEAHINSRPLPALPDSQSLSQQYLADTSANSPTSSDYELMSSAKDSIHHSLKSNKEKSGMEAALTKEKIIGKQCRPLSRMNHRTEDSGYLSTDSNGSEAGARKAESISETDDSFFDGASESGAESIATDSFFFGKCHNFSTTTKQPGNITGSNVPFSDSDSNVSQITILQSQQRI